MIAISTFLFPLLLAALAVWKRSLFIVIAAIFAGALSLPSLFDAGGHYAIPILILTIGLALMLVYDAITRGLRI